MKFVFWIPQADQSAATTGATSFCAIVFLHKRKKKNAYWKLWHLLEVPGEVKSKKYIYLTTT